MTSPTGRKSGSREPDDPHTRNATWTFSSVRAQQVIRADRTACGPGLYPARVDPGGGGAGHRAGRGGAGASRFFQGRKLDEEAQRFLSLTRYGQSRAVSEGVPMVLWVDPDARLYGLTAETTYTENDPRAVEFTLDDNLILELDPSTEGDVITPWPQTQLVAGNRAALRFTPDGFVCETSPERILFIQETDVDESIIVVALDRYRLRYEMQTNLVYAAGR